MAWNVEQNDEEGIIELKFRGKINSVEIHDSTEKALSMASEDLDTLFLSDFSDAHVELSALEIYNIPDQWEEAGANRNNRVAVVLAESTISVDDAKFYENVVTNRGWNVCVFHDRDSAISWLKEVRD